MKRYWYKNKKLYDVDPGDADRVFVNAEEYDELRQEVYELLTFAEDHYDSYDRVQEYASTLESKLKDILDRFTAYMKGKV